MVFINNKNLKDYISIKTYNVNKESVYTSFLDGNYVEHRKEFRKKISGSFTLEFYGQGEMDVFLFNKFLEENTVNGITTMTVYVNNTGELETINAYVKTNCNYHREDINGFSIDKIVVELEER